MKHEFKHRVVYDYFNEGNEGNEGKDVVPSFSMHMWRIERG